MLLNSSHGARAGLGYFCQRWRKAVPLLKVANEGNYLFSPVLARLPLVQLALRAAAAVGGRNPAVALALDFASLRKQTHIIANGLR